MLRRAAGRALAAAHAEALAAPVLHAGGRCISASSRLEAPLAATRALAQKKKPGGGGGGGGAAAAPEEKYDLKTQIPVNLLKGEEGKGRVRARTRAALRNVTAGGRTPTPRLPRPPFPPSADGGEPEYKADDQYPPWLFKLIDEKPILEDYVMQGLENVPTGEMKRVFRIANKRRIKEYNTSIRKE
jgi:hypothetical protein